MYFSGGGTKEGDMLKAAGSVLVISATVLFGLRKAEMLHDEYVQMQYVRQLFYWVQSEIRYAGSPLGEIFSYIGKSAREPYGTWLKGLGTRLEKRDGGTFEEIWKTSIDESLGGCALSGEELLKLKELGERLGLADVTMQVKILELYLTRLELSMEEMQGEMKSKVRLCHCLGIMSGILIVILLL